MVRHFKNLPSFEVQSPGSVFLGQNRILIPGFIKFRTSQHTDPFPNCDLIFMEHYGIIRNKNKIKNQSFIQFWSSWPIRIMYFLSWSSKLYKASKNLTYVPCHTYCLTTTCSPETSFTFIILIYYGVQCIFIFIFFWGGAYFIPCFAAFPV